MPNENEKKLIQCIQNADADGFEQLAPSVDLLYVDENQKGFLQIIIELFENNKAAYPSYTRMFTKVMDLVVMRGKSDSTYQKKHHDVNRNFMMRFSKMSSEIFGAIDLPVEKMISPLDKCINDDNDKHLKKILPRYNISDHELFKKCILTNAKKCAALLVNRHKYEADANNFTPIFYAYQRSDTKTIIEILVLPEYLYVDKKFHSTPFHRAIEQDCLELLKLLFEQNKVDKKYNLNERDHKDRTALLIAVRRGVKAVKELLKLAEENNIVLDVNAADIHGNTPLSAAKSQNDAESVRLLIEAGAKEVNVESNNTTENNSNNPASKAKSKKKKKKKKVTDVVPNTTEQDDLNNNNRPSVKTNSMFAPAPAPVPNSVPTEVLDPLTAIIKELEQQGFKDSDVGEVSFEKWGITKDAEFHEALNKFLDLFYSELAKAEEGGKKPEEYDGIYSVGSATVRALLPNTKPFKIGDIDFIICGVEQGAVQSAFERSADFPDHSCTLMISPFDDNSSLKVEFKRDASGHIMQNADIVAVKSKEFVNNLYGRDVTVSGIVLDLVNHKIIAPLGWLKDLVARRIKTIDPDPVKSFTHDFGRKLRVIRLLKKLAAYGFKIDEKTYQAIINPNISYQACLQYRKEQYKKANQERLEKMAAMKEKQSRKLLFELADMPNQASKRATVAEPNSSTASEYSFLDEAMARSVRNQLEKMIESLGIEETVRALKEFNTTDQLRVSERDITYLVSELKFPAKYNAVNVRDTILEKRMLELRKQKPDVRVWAELDDNMNVIAAVIRHMETEDTVYNKTCRRFLAFLIMAGVNMEPILAKVKDVPEVLVRAPKPGC